MFKKLLLSVILIVCLTTTGFANQPMYQLNENYTAVRNDIFDQLTEKDRLVDLLEEELEYANLTIQQLKDLHSQNDDLYERRIVILKDVLGLKDEIISYKDSQINNYNQLYQIKSAEANRRVFKNWFDKFLLLSVGAYAVSQIDDNTGKAAVSAITVYLFNN